MRYKAQCTEPRYLGGVDEFDVYITPVGNIIARHGSEHGAFVRLYGIPYVKGKSHQRFKEWGMPHSPDVPDRIEAMIMCFAPDVCAE